MSGRVQYLLWADSLLLICLFTCAPPSLRPGPAIVVESLVMAALHPVGVT